MQEARDWLAKAFELAREPDKLKLRALEEAELEFWTEAQRGVPKIRKHRSRKKGAWNWRPVA